MSKINLILRSGIWIVLASTALPLYGQKMASYYSVYLRPFKGPQAYAPKEKRMLLYVESDGVHLSAITFSGKVLWTEDPHKLSKIGEYRTKNPRIIYIGPALKWPVRGYNPDNYASISYNNSQSLLVNLETGKVEPLGQD